MSKNKHVARHAAPQSSGLARVTTTVAVTGGLVAGVAVAETAVASSPESASAKTAAATTAAATQPLHLKAITPAKSLKAAPARAHVAAAKAPVKVSRSRARAALSAPTTGATAAAATPAVAPTPAATQAPRHHHRHVARKVVHHTAATTPRVRHHRARRALTNPTSYAGPAAPAAPVARSTSNVVAIASGLTGIPYVWGGSTTAGFDCSGFVSYVYARVGIQLPHQSGAIRAMATPVSDPRPGDLVFLPGHVAIYAGNGMVYEAHHPGTPSGLYPLLPGSTFGRIG